MISNIKRYKHLINTIERGIKKKQSSSRFDTFGTFHTRYINLTDELYNLRMAFTFHISFKNVINEVGTDGNIYIGFSLDDIAIAVFSDDEIIDKISSTASYNNNTCGDMIRSKLNDEGVGPENYYNSDAIKSTKLFKDIRKKLDSVINSIDIDIHLRDKEFPKLKNRKMIPVYIIDVEKGWVDYAAFDDTSSYRSKRAHFSFSEAQYEDNFKNSLHYSLEWVDFDISCNSKYADKITIT